jgi:putative Holliday junction resolvase
MVPMVYIGLDFGAKRIGVAISDQGGVFAFPKMVLPNDKDAVPAILALVKKESAETVVIGNTRSLSGQANAITERLENFIQELEVAGLRVERIWEGWSSHEAARFAPKGKTHDDAAAAAIILQRYLEMHVHGVQ